MSCIVTKIILGLSLIVFITAGPDRAPPDVCGSMIPTHNASAQTSDPPYNIITEAISDGRFIITLQPNNSENYFRGFIMQVRDKESKPIGEFFREIEAELMDCPPGHNNSLTHSDKETMKYQQKVTWKSPPQEKFQGEAYVIATVIGEEEEMTEFWVGVKSDPFYVNKKD